MILTNDPGATFIPGATSTPESRVYSFSIFSSCNNRITRENKNLGKPKGQCLFGKLERQNSSN